MWSFFFNKLIFWLSIIILLILEYCVYLTRSRFLKGDNIPVSDGFDYQGATAAKM